MFGSRTTFAAVAALTLGALGVSAELTPTQMKYAGCGGSLKLINMDDVYYWEYDDPAFYNVTYSYDPTYCDSTIPVNYIKLIDYSTGTAYTCSREQFAANKTTVHGQCVITHGTMATMARDAGQDGDWTIEMQYGTRSGGQLINYAEFFAVAPPPAPPAEETSAPTPSGSFQKRRSVESQHKFDCPTGHTYCWTGERQEYACMDTSSDVTACGRCPYAAGNDESGGDCTSIEGADDVQCLRSKCVVNACERGFQVSLDRTKCLDGSKRSIMSRGILF